LISVFISLLSLIKGWFTIVVLPLLIIAIPILFVTRIVVRNLIIRGEYHPYLPIFARLQLIGIVVFYLCLPGVSDDDFGLVFGLIWVNLSRPIADFSTILSYGGGLISLISTIAIFTLYFWELLPKIDP